MPADFSRLARSSACGAAADVDDPGVVGAGAQPGDQRFGTALLARDAIGEVGAVEAADVNRRVAQRQPFDDVGADAIGRGRREREERHVGEPLAQLGDAAVVGTEVVAPFADAVRFVDREARRRSSVASSAANDGIVSRSGAT